MKTPLRTRNDGCYHTGGAAEGWEYHRGMLHRHAAALLAASLGMTLVAAAAPRIAQSPGQRIVAVGDIHGSLEGLTEIIDHHLVESRASLSQSQTLNIKVESGR